MKHCFILLLIILLSQTVEAQKYAVFFKDKNGTPYSLSQPEEFLSQRALERRGKFDISLTDDDLPVNPAYVAALKDAGATVLFSSRWLNCTLIQCTTDVINPIKELACVDSVVLVYPHHSSVQPQEEKPVIFNDFPSLKKYDPFYGNASNQIEQINGIKLHEKGYEGDGVLIAVLDGGFRNANTISAFNDLYKSGRLLMAKDFIEPDGDIYRAGISGHGTNVLSCMAAYLPNQMVGTAPKASYCLFRTEDTTSEYIIEEYAWVIGAEAADSIGADLINSSLAYIDYDDPAMSHSYSDMDGQTTIASVGARKAVERGVFVCVSAGNDGNNASWRWIGTPSDVAQALTVGAVQSNGQYASFSSIGPNAAGEQKPNVMAQGASAAVVNTEGAVTTSNGTSFSSPIICGMVACLLQASPFTKPEKLKNAIEASSSFYATPSYQMGYGIPDFYKTLQSLPVMEHSKCNNILIYPNPVADMLTVKSKNRIEKALLYDVTGRLVVEQSLPPYNYKISTQKLSSGMYIIHFYGENGMTGCAKFIKE